MSMEFLIGHYAYWCIVILLCIGLYAVMFKRNLIKKVIGLTIFQSTVILFWVASASKWNATVPIYDTAIPLDNPANYINPLPHTLMLTAIVVGVATLGVAFSLIIMIYRNYKTLDENALIEEMKNAE